MRKIFLLVLLAAGAASCGSGKAGKARLQGVRWDAAWIRINDSASFDRPDPLPFLIFTSDSTISGNTGCNGFAGRYTVDDNDKITLSVEAVTMIICMEVETEQTYLEQLQMAERYSLRGDTLVLSDPGNVPQIKFIKNKIE